MRLGQGTFIYNIAYRMTQNGNAIFIVITFTIKQKEITLLSNLTQQITLLNNVTQEITFLSNLN